MSKQNSKTERRLVRRGDKVDVITSVPKTEMTALDLLLSIDQLQKVISKTESDMAQMRDNLVRMEQSVVNNKETIKKFEKHADWARGVQESLFKVVVESLEQEVFEKVEKLYKVDEALTTEQNNKQRYHQYRQYIATHNKMASAVAPEIVSVKLFEENYLKNPWGGKD